MGEATARAGLIFTCIPEFCQKQDTQLCGPSLSDYLVLMVVNIIYSEDTLGRLQSESLSNHSSARQR